MNTDMKTYILWGLPAGKSNRLDEKPLVSFPITAAQAEKVKAVASKDGWHGFRLALEDHRVPEFGKAVAI
jgi:hypothetical protein